MTKKFRIIWLLLPVIMAACSKKEVVIVYVNTDTVNANATLISKDTALNGATWDGNGRTIRTINGAIISGGTLKNWIIDGPYTVQMFDTSINLEQCVPYKDRFSVAWYGANPDKKDNWWYLQKSINACLNNHIWYCFVPAFSGREYSYSKTLDIKSIYNGNYAFCSLKFGGEGSFWTSWVSTLRFTGIKGSAYNFQLNKGSEFGPIKLNGPWKSPGGTDSAYFSHTSENFNDVSGNNIGNNLYGITIDGYQPIDGKTTSGSTGITFNDVTVDGFAILIALSPNGITANDDIMRFNDIHLGNGYIGIQNGQAQEKDIRFNGIYCWGNIYCLISIGHAGKYQAGDYAFSNGSIAGRVIRLFDISAAGWYSTHIDNFYAESIKEVGVISTQIPITISKSTFNLNPMINKERIVLWGNSSMIDVSSSIIGYNDGQKTNVWVHGQMNIEANCSFRGGQLIFK